MTNGPENPYGEQQPPPPPPTSPYQQQPSHGQQPPSWGQQPTSPQDPYQQPYQQPYPPTPYGAYPPGYTAAQQNEGMAVASMVIGIVSLVLACGYGVGLLGSPAAMIMGRVSMKRIDRSNGQLGGRGMAQAGFILGIIGTVLLVLGIILVIVLVIAAANGAFEETNY